MRYYLQDPNGNETEVTALVLRALESIVEMAFDLETAVVPSDFNMDLDNSGGQFDSAQGLFAAGERTRFLVIVRSDDGENILFIGTVKDTIYTETSKVEIESKSVIAALLGCSFNMASVTTWDPMVEKTPARLVADLLGPDGLQLPGIFLDNVFFDLADESEQNLGLKMRLEIPNGESIPFTDFLQELNRVTGAYVYSYNGYIRYARQGGFDRAGFDYTFDGTVIAGTVKNSRPVLWQKTRVEAMYWDGSAVQKVVKTMADFFDVEGESIMDEFREKTIESDGLSGKLIHATLASAEVGLQDVLSWRGRPRWDFEFEVDAIGHDVRGMAQSVPLLSRVRLLWGGGCAQLAVVEKTTNDQKTTLKCKSLAAPTFIHPAKRLLPVVTQNFDEISFNNNTPFDMVLYYKIEGETAFTRVLLPQEDIHTITLPDFESVTWKVAWGLPCGELMGDEQTFNPIVYDHFILGTSVLGDMLG